MISQVLLCDESAISDMSIYPGLRRSRCLKFKRRLVAPLTDVSSLFQSSFCDSLKLPAKGFFVEMLHFGNVTAGPDRWSADFNGKKSVDVCDSGQGPRSARSLG